MFVYCWHNDRPEIQHFLLLSSIKIHLTSRVSRSFSQNPFREKQLLIVPYATLLAKSVLLNDGIVVLFKMSK